MQANKNLWTRRLGGPQAYNNIYQQIKVNEPKDNSDCVGPDKWFSKLDAGPLVANAYNRPIVFLPGRGESRGTTFLPSTKPPGERPQDPIFLAFFGGNHWLLVNVKRGITPVLPPDVPRLFSNLPAGEWLTQMQPSVDLLQAITNCL